MLSPVRPLHMRSGALAAPLQKENQMDNRPPVDQTVVDCIKRWGALMKEWETSPFLTGSSNINQIETRKYLQEDIARLNTWFPVFEEMAERLKAIDENQSEQTRPIQYITG